MSKKSGPLIKLAIAVPTYNEAKNLPKLVRQIKSNIAKTNVTCALLIIDDNSPDGTGELADKLVAKESTKQFKVSVLHRKNKEGLGRAYVAGLNKLLGQNYTHIMQMDADFSHNPKYIQDFVREAYAGRDFVAASRYMKGGSIQGWALHRRILSFGGNIYTRFFLGSRITDYTNGLNMFSSKLLKKVDIDSLGAGGYGFFIELKYTAIQYAQSYTQIPIVLTDRENGKSKLPRNTIFINLVLVPKLRFSVKKKVKANK
ncbi:MAG TPA: polyprenol monophosphomannose synthase [Methylomirabilota bacterium]|nr:polyprenol monophosphomannose synthase [Methylomirabilota bacterium]